MAAKKVYLLSIYSEMVFPEENYFIIRDKDNIGVNRMPITDYQFNWLKSRFNYSLYKRIMIDKTIKKEAFIYA